MTLSPHPPNTTVLARKAELLRSLHHGPNVLLLPNAWDAATARILEEAGYPAVATTSAGIAFLRGYPDGQKISRDEMLQVVSWITRAVDVPVTADMEAGYGDRPEDAAATARGVIEAGGVGLNFEDGTDDPEHPLFDLNLQVEKLISLREEGRRAGVPLVINARTDVYLANVGAPEKRYDLAMKRAVAFKKAGADCVFVPGLRDPDVIAQFVKELDHPINILAGPGYPTITELQKLGVARVSLGSGPMRASLGLMKRIAQELKTTGTYASLLGAPSHGEVNALMGR